MKGISVSIFIAILLIGGAYVLTKSDSVSVADTRIKENVSLVDGKQIIEIDAKGGYSPEISLAKAGVPTILKINTRGTFDCSSALTIPSIGYSSNLPPSGTTEIEIPAQEVGSTLQGLCGMGMFNFQIKFN